MVYQLVLIASTATALTTRVKSGQSLSEIDVSLGAIICSISLGLLQLA